MQRGGRWSVDFMYRLTISGHPVRSLSHERGRWWPFFRLIFGTGYDSFSYLRELPATEIRIDRAFISPIVGDERVRHLVYAMVEVGEALGLTVTAEGVETEGQAAILTELGCHLGQGFLWSPALPAENLRHWLAKPQADGTADRSASSG